MFHLFMPFVIKKINKSISHFLVLRVTYEIGHIELMFLFMKDIVSC